VATPGYARKPIAETLPLKTGFAREHTNSTYSAEMNLVPNWMTGFKPSRKSFWLRTNRGAE